MFLSRQDAATVFTAVRSLAMGVAPHSCTDTAHAAQTLLAGAPTPSSVPFESMLPSPTLLHILVGTLQCVCHEEAVKLADEDSFPMDRVGPVELDIESAAEAAGCQTMGRWESGRWVPNRLAATVAAVADLDAMTCGRCGHG